MASDKRNPPASSPSTAAPPSASSSLPSPSPLPSQSPPLFMCCVSLPGPLQPLSLASSSSPSSSPCSSSSSSADLPPRHSLPTLSEIAHIKCSKTSLTTPHPHPQRSHVAELLLFRSRRKPGVQHLQAHPHQAKQQSKHSSSTTTHRGYSHRNDLLDLAAHNGKHTKQDARNSWELLKSGEVSNLIKQGFMERTQRRHSPGRVSPLMQETIAASAEIVSPLYASSRKVTPGLYLHDVHATPRASPPPSDKPAKPNTLNTPSDKPTKANTLFNMMSRDAEIRAKPKEGAVPVPSILQRQRSSGAVLDVANARHPLFNNWEGSDVNLVLRGRDGGEVCLNLHSSILVERSKYFAARLSKAWCNQQQRQNASPCLLEIEDCEDMEAYQETLHLMYCQDLQARLIKWNVPRVLAILKVSALILFESCTVCCLEYLEAVPWAEDEEERVRAVLGQLEVGNFASANVLKRLNTEESCGSKETLVQLLEMVIKGKDNKARRELKALVSKMLRENVSQNGDCADLSRESLYQACTTCLDALSGHFLQASRADFMNQGNGDRGTRLAEIAHQADNLLWLLEILLDRHIANDFVKMWAHQSELARIHTQIATVLRFEVSRLTARLCVAIGRGQVLCPVEVRYMLLQTWLSPLVDDFGWMQRCCKGLDKNVVEDGISQTILTLPLKQQESILLAWFDRFSNNGDDCPNLQRAFEVWWRRTFLRSCIEEQGGTT